MRQSASRVLALQILDSLGSSTIRDPARRPAPHVSSADFGGAMESAPTEYCAYPCRYTCDYVYAGAER